MARNLINFFPSYWNRINKKILFWSKRNFWRWRRCINLCSFWKLWSDSKLSWGKYYWNPFFRIWTYSSGYKIPNWRASCWCRKAFRKNWRRWWRAKRLPYHGWRGIKNKTIYKKATSKSPLLFLYNFKYLRGVNINKVKPTV